MLLQPSAIEELIINYLKNGPKRTSELLTYFIKKSYTKQGVYKIIRKLKNGEVITVSNKKVSLSSIWLKKMSDFFALVQYNYRQPMNIPDFLSLGEQQKTAFSFKTLEELDIFAAHAFYLLSQVMEKNRPIFVYNFHQWFYYGRHENDEFLAYRISTRQPLLLLLGSNTPLDQAVKKEYNKANSQAYILEHTKFSSNYYFGILGDFLLEFYIDQSAAQQLDIFYKKYGSYSSSAKTELNQIIGQRGKNRVIISRNSKKIKKLETIFKKYFHIKK